MNRIARSNLSVVAWFTATIAVCVALTGCWGKDIFRPKNDFYGTEKNLTQWRLYCPEPPNSAG